MNLSIAKAHRPFARFDYSDNGKYVIVKLMQHGDKFSETEKNADDWLADITMKAQMGQYDAGWVAQFKLEYDAFLKGNELPREGTPVRTWAALTREQGTRLVALGITTVEDLAAQPDGGIGLIGLDGRYLRDLARNFLESGNSGAAMAKKIADLEQRDRDNTETIKQMAQTVQELKAMLPEDKKTLHVPSKKAA